MWWWVAQALAEIPLPSWREELLAAEWAAINTEIETACVAPKFVGQAVTCHEAPLRGAIDRATRFQSEVTEDGGLEYLVGLAHRYLGDKSAAELHYTRATVLRPADRGAWNDLGEIYLADGRWDDAERAFAQVSQLTRGTPQSWIGPWRLAEVAAHQHDTAGFELNIREALRQGFTFQTIAGLPNWQAFYADPALHDSIEKLVTVFGDRKILDTLRQAP